MHQKSIEQTCQAVQSHFSRVRNVVIGQVNKRFASFAADRILSSLSVFSPQLWPDDSDDIEFGDEQIVFLSEHFATPLEKQGLNPSLCLSEWTEVKQLVRDHIRYANGKNKQW